MFRFWMGRYEVTWEQYAPFVYLPETEVAKMQEGRRAPIDRDGISHPSKSYSLQDYGPSTQRYPALGMGWIGAFEYCRWLSKKTGVQYRLPTEAEWEHACRAGATTAFFWGDSTTNADQYAWFRANSAAGEVLEKPHPVGKLKPNAFGLFDMAGNAAEWCAKTHPETPGVVRGGAFCDPSDRLRCSDRHVESPEWDALDPEYPPSPWWLSINFVGFRLVRSFSP